MNIEIPKNLLLPTVEELEQRTAQDLTVKWKLRKRPGKKERNAIKQEKETAKLKAIANEYNNPNQTSSHAANNLNSLFVQKDKQKFSLNAINANTNREKLAVRPTLRASLKEATTGGIITNTLPPKLTANEDSFVRKRGRPPKLKST